MILLDFQKMFTLEELFCYTIQISPRPPMIQTIYTEAQLLQGIKDQDPILLSWIYKRMAPIAKNLFHEMKLSKLAGATTYDQLFQTGMKLLRKDIRYRKVSKGLLKRLELLLKNICLEHFIDEAGVREWLVQYAHPKIEQLIKAIKINPIAPSATTDIFEKLYAYLKATTAKAEGETGKLLNLVDYSIKVKTADHFLLEEKMWTWIDQDLRRLAINSYLYKIKQRQDINCDAIFNESLKDAWNNVKEKQYTLGQNIFEYIKGIYAKKLSNVLNKKKIEMLSKDDEPMIVSSEVSYQQNEEELAILIEESLTQEILQEAMLASVKDLKPNQRDLIYDFKLKGKSLIQIAKDRNYQEKSMKVLNSRANKALLNLYFQRLLRITKNTIDPDCFAKLKDQSFKVKDQAVAFCRKELKLLAQKVIQSFLQSLRHMDPMLSDEDRKSFIHFVMTEGLSNQTTISMHDLSKWKAAKS